MLPRRLRLAEIAAYTRPARGGAARRRRQRSSVSRRPRAAALDARDGARSHAAARRHLRAPARGRSRRWLPPAPNLELLDERPLRRGDDRRGRRRRGDAARAARRCGASAKLVTSRYDGTALIAAAHLGHDGVVRQLIAAGAPLDHVNNLHWTARDRGDRPRRRRVASPARRSPALHPTPGASTCSSPIAPGARRLQLARAARPTSRWRGCCRSCRRALGTPGCEPGRGEACRPALHARLRHAARVRMRWSRTVCVEIEGRVVDDRRRPSSPSTASSFERRRRALAVPRARAAAAAQAARATNARSKPRHHPSVLTRCCRRRCAQRGVQPIGRLDEDTTGVLLLTDDGALIHRLTSPKHHVPKVYEVRLPGTRSSGAQLERLRARRGARRRPEAGAAGRRRDHRPRASCD